MQLGRIGKSVVFKMTLIAWYEFNPHSGHVVTSLDQTLYNDYLCFVASTKKQIPGTRIQRHANEN